MMKPIFLAAIALLIFSCKSSTVPANWAMGPFVKPKENPVLKADSSYIFNCPVRHKLVRWQLADVFNPAAIVRHDTVFVLFRAEDNPDAGIGGRTSRIGLAYSSDGLNFTKYTEPVLYPDSSAFIQYDFPGGCEDPRIVEKEDGTYVLLYTSWNGDIARLSAATSTDLYHWQKHGPVFAKALGGKFKDVWSKSGSVVTEMNKASNRLVAKKINGKYWMYFGDKLISMASSENLVDWTISETKNNSFLNALSPRIKKFDSDLVEPGPPALFTSNGILLLYNGRNALDSTADPSLPRGMYSGGQALFDTANPSHLIIQIDTCFIKPDLPHETSGQYASGTTFIEGLVYFKGKWFLYYGTADSMVGVAVMEGK
ncbi:MAG: glycoside hydrolase family 130 protein [Chitinophagaceae bacterium]